jgi:hypothetical protein
MAEWAALELTPERLEELRQERRIKATHETPPDQDDEEVTWDGIEQEQTMWED